MKAISFIFDNEVIYEKEFLNKREKLEKAELTKKEKNKLNKFIGSLDARTYKLMTFTIAALMFASKNVMAATEQPEKLEKTWTKIEKLGEQILFVLQRAGLWIAILGCIIEILISVFKKNGGKDEIIGLIFKWFLIIVAVFVVPAAFKFIAGWF